MKLKPKHLFHKIQPVTLRYNVQGGGISVLNFNTAVLEFPKFRSFGKTCGGGGATVTKDALIERKSSQNVPAVKDHMLLPTKSVQHIKNKHLGNMWWTIKNHMLPFYAKP